MPKNRNHFKRSRVAGTVPSNMDINAQAQARVWPPRSAPRKCRSQEPEVRRWWSGVRDLKLAENSDRQTAWSASFPVASVARNLQEQSFDHVEVLLVLGYQREVILHRGCRDQGIKDV